MEASSLPRPGGRLALRPSRRLLAPLSDERLVQQLRRGNEAAFEVIYDRHHRGILSFCRHMLRSPEEAEDALQHTFVSAYADLATTGKPIRLKPWLYAIARNRCLSMLRARREQAVELPEIPTAGLSEAVLERDDLRRLLADVQSLPEDQRAALVLSELGDLSHAEVAEVVGCEPVKVKALVFQARSSLAESRRASEIPCHEIREQLATLRGGALRRGPLRRHLRACAGCSEFRSEVARQRTMLALALPVLPTAGLKQGVLAAAGLTPGAAGGAVAGGALTGGAATSGAATAGGATAGGASLCGVGSVTGGGALSSLGAAGAAKVALVAAVAATGGVAIDQATSTSAERHGSPAAAHQGAARHRGSHAPPGAVVVPADRGLQSSGGHGEKKGQAAGGAAAAQHGKAHKGHGKAAHGSHGRAGAPGRAHGSHGSGNRVEEPVGGTGAQSSAPGGGTQSPAPGIGRQGGSHGPPATKPPHPDHPSTGRGNSGGAANGHHLGG